MRIVSFGPRTLRRRFLAALIAVSVIPLAALGVLIDRYGSAVLMDRSFAELSTVALFKSRELETWVEARQNAVVQSASLPRHRRLAASLLERHAAAQGSLELREVLESVRRRQGFGELFVVDAREGRIVLSTDPEQEGKFRNDRPYFREGRRKPFTQNVYYSLGQGRPAMAFAAPYLDAHGQPVAVLVGRVHLRFLDAIMAERAGLGQTGRSFVVNRFNYFVSDTLGRGPLGWRPVWSDGVNRALAGQTGTVVYRAHDGRRVIGAYRALPGLGLGLVVEQDEREALASVRHLRLAILGGLLVVAGLAVSAGLVFAYEISRPLGRLVTAVRAIGSGQLEHRVPPGGSEELATLASAMNRMADDLLGSRQALETHSQTLEARVRERTAESEARRRAAEALAEVGRLISRSLDPKVVGQLIVDNVRAVLGVQSARLLERLPNSDDLLVLATCGEAQVVGRGSVMPSGTGVVGLAVRRREPIVTHDVLADPRITLPHDLRARLEIAHARGVLAVPLLVGDRVIGALAITGGPGMTLDSEAVRLVQAFADQAVVALENSRLHSAALRRGEELGALLRATRTVIGDLNLSGALERIIDEASQMALTPHVGVLLVDPATRILRAAAVRGAVLPEAAEMPLGTGYSGTVAETGRWLFIANVQDDPANVLAEHDRGVGMRTYLGLPIVRRDEVLGVLTFTTTEPRRYSAAEIEYLTSFADNAAIAIANARLFAEAERRRQEAESLAELGQLVSRSLDPEVVGHLTVESVCRLVSARMAVLYRLDPSSGDLIFVSGVGPEVDWNQRLSRGTATAGLAVTERRPVTTTDLLDDPRISLTPEARHRIERSGYRAVLAVPLLIQDAVIGALGIGDNAGRVFDTEDIRLAQSFADQAAIALENARLYQETRRAYDELSRVQEQLMQSQKMEAVGRLAGGIAHDFNNLLTIINGRGQLLLKRLPPEDPMRRDLGLIVKTGERAAQLTRQLLAFSRKQVLQPEVLDLNRLVSDLVAMLRRLIGEHIRLDLDLAPSLGWINADPGQTEQVIMNLAVNARDAMPRGGTLTIRTADVELDPAFVEPYAVVPGRYVFLEVRDTGHGMDESTRRRIFEPFFTTKPRGQGTGLGLSTVYGIVKQSGGCIAVDSEPGRGTTFSVYLPRLEEPARIVTTLVKPEKVASGTETVLLVEDEDDVRSLAREALELGGYTVLATRDGDEAIRVSEEYARPIHLLLTDVIMPGPSGPEAARQITKQRPGMRVLYMSGYTDDAIFANGLLDRQAAYLAKPFAPDELLTTVRAALDASRNGHRRTAHA